MSRYADIEILEEKIKTIEIITENEDLKNMHESLKRGILELIKFIQPSDDVAEVKHGRWVRTHNPIGQEITVCSVCGEMKRQATGNYCGMCGAKMDEVEDGLNR